MKGKEFGVKECPTHRIVAEIGGNTSVLYTFYRTLAWIVWFNLTFLNKVAWGFDFNYLY